jgi:ParB-like chromosome segregation protein Spo0J
MRYPCLAASIKKVPIDKLKASQMASETTREGVQHYREHIRNGNKIKPITVVHSAQSDRYHILDGHHRAKALKLEGHTQAPVDVVHRAKNDRDAREHVRMMRFG